MKKNKKTFKEFIEDWGVGVIIIVLAIAFLLGISRAEENKERMVQTSSQAAK